MLLLFPPRLFQFSRSLSRICNDLALDTMQRLLIVTRQSHQSNLRGSVSVIATEEIIHGRGRRRRRKSEREKLLATLFLHGRDPFLNMLMLSDATNAI